MIRISTLVFTIFISASLYGQLKPSLPQPANGTKLNPEKVAPPLNYRPGVPAAAPAFPQGRTFGSIPSLPKPIGGAVPMRVYVSQETGTPYRIEGQVPADTEKSLETQVLDYLNIAGEVLKMKSPAQEFAIKTSETDELGHTHVRLQQMWKGVPVHAAEAILHKKDGAFHLFNGRFYPTPNLPDVKPVISGENAAGIALAHAGNFAPVKNLLDWEKQFVQTEQTSANLTIYHPGKKVGGERLAWHVVVVPNLAARYSYFVDAKTGEVLNHYNELCQLSWHLNRDREHQHTEKCTHAPNEPLAVASPAPLPPDGPAEADANDLFGISRHIHTYQKSNVYYLIDASRTMFKSNQSIFPNEAVGVILTVDALNTSPENNNFAADHITSSNNVWNNSKAVSAHYNAAKSYEYFKNTFNRESINAQGGNILSFINVAESDGSGMDNAFWNGAAMFYGNGNQGFKAPLCKSLDVTGHELTHGVVQSTSNLEYYGESGALNESFADVFGAMIDRDDWRMGEDVVNPIFFPTGALRDLSNPHNGGSSLNDNGWQPAHYAERYTGEEDNAGVHINSGIPNKAFFLIASNASVGKDKAEQIYYRALTKYLVKSSQFVDCRNAVVQSATDLYGAAAADAANAAFDAVGIGAGSGTNSQTDINQNSGDDFVLLTDNSLSTLYIFTPGGQPVANPLSSTNITGRPSVTDDGSAIYFIDETNRMRRITINWQTGNVNEQIIQNEPIWRNVAVSKDGARLAALTTDYDNELWVAELGSPWGIFNLYNPTTGQGGPTTGNVVYADVLEWDVSGEWVMYDALNRIKTTTGDDIEYWDISFIRVWNKSINNFGDGFTGKLFSLLPEDVSVGNPTFAKNSDYIIAFDYLDNFTEEYYLMAANVETGAVSEIFYNLDLSWPSYSVDDKMMVFDAEDNAGTPVLAMIPLGTDKISASGNAFIFIENGRRGVWFANGTRVLTGSQEVFSQNNVRLYPNPVGDQLTLEFLAKNTGETSVELFDLMGKKVLAKSFAQYTGENRLLLPLTSLPGGTYVLRLMTEGGGAVALKVVKR
jgi:Zn-dependent metalloprotease